MLLISYRSIIVQIVQNKISEQTHKHTQPGINCCKGGVQLQSISNTCFARIMVKELFVAISNKWGAEHGRGAEQNLLLSGTIGCGAELVGRGAEHELWCPERHFV